MIVRDKHPYQSLFMYSNNFEVQTVVGSFMEYFNTSEKINKAYAYLNNPELDYRNLGMNDDSIQIEEKHVVFDYLYDKSGMRFEKLYPFKLDIENFKTFLDEVKDFITKYETQKIPGLVPRNDFLNWSVAPNEVIENSYLKKQYQICNSILNEIGFDQKNSELIDIMRFSPQLIDELQNHISITNKEIEKIKGINLALIQIVKNGKYYGNIEGMMYSKIMDYKIQEHNLPLSIRSELGYRIGHRNFDIAELDNLLIEWKSKLDDKEHLKELLSELNLLEFETEINQTFIRYPNLLIELEELLPKHRDVVSTKFLKEIIIEKIDSQQSSENLEGYLKGRIINHLIEKHKLPNENWKTSEEIRQWSFKNEWGLNAFEEYINTNMK